VDDSRKWERCGALGGIAFVVLVIVSIIIGGSMPKASDSATKILKYFRDNTDGIKVGAFLGGLATVPILWWAGSLFVRLRRAEGGQPRLSLIALLGLVLGGAAAGTQAAINATVALDIKAVGDAEARFFFLLGQAMSAGDPPASRYWCSRLRCWSSGPRCSRPGWVGSAWWTGSCSWWAATRSRPRVTA
jgi:hypothetical protein